MFDNLNSLLLDIFEESRLSGETYSSKIQEIESVSDVDGGFNNCYLRHCSISVIYKMINV